MYNKCKQFLTAITGYQRRPLDPCGSGTTILCLTHVLPIPNCWRTDAEIKTNTSNAL